VAALTDVSIEHVWVKTRINGSWYVFDPSYKPHTFKSGIDLASATTTGYDAATHLSSAQSGATVTADYVQNLNRTNIRNNLNTYATKLATYLRANTPAATLDDVLGGKTVVPFYGALRQTALPYQNTAWGSEELAELPGYMKPTLRVQYQGIDQTYTSDAIYGRRLTLTYNGANQPILKLDGVAVGAPGTAVTPGASTPITFTVTHNAYVSTWANHSFTQKGRRHQHLPDRQRLGPRRPWPRRELPKSAQRPQGLRRRRCLGAPAGLHPGRDRRAVDRPERPCRHHHRAHRRHHPPAPAPGRHRRLHRQRLRRPPQQRAGRG
jgi:hypothetical protein